VLCGTTTVAASAIENCAVIKSRSFYYPFFFFWSPTAEAERIRKCKGRVFALQDEPEVARVWLPNNDSPGLAMARAFGDFCLKDFGLISVPDISYWHLTEKDEFIVLATDGVRAVLILRSFSVYCIVYEISLLSLINGIFCCFDLF